jgi:hypothetical protein
MPEDTIEQGLLEPTSAGWELKARSPGWRDDWQPEIERLCSGFGRPPVGEHLPLCVFAQPLGRDHVAVIQAAADGALPVLRFHALVLPNPLYSRIGDPFAIAEQFPPPWGARVVLPTLAWTEDLPDRSIERVQRILQEDDSATLLGGAQALVDGSRIVFERSFPAPDLLRRLWALLPNSTRAEIWPASYVFAPDLDWHAAVVPRYDAANWPEFLTEQQAGDYPDGRYELNLQIAAESGDQAGLDRLFARRTSRQTLKLAITLLLAAIGVLVLSRMF